MRTMLLTLLLVLAGCANAPEPSTDTPTDATPPADSTASTAPAAPPVQVQASKSTGAIRGVVVDEGVRPIAAATVRLQATGQTVESDAAGQFGFSNLDPGIHFLNITHPDYLPAQSSARVEAGAKDPDMLEVQLVLDTSKTARFEQAFVTMRVPGDICVAGECRRLASGSNSTLGVQTWAMVTTTGAPRAIQAEVHWTATSDLGVWGRLSCQGISATGSQRFDAVTGVESIVVRVPGSIEGENGPEGIDRFLCDFAADGAANPVVAMVSQEVDTIITTFYNFEPTAAWTATKDGEPTVPV